MYREADKKRDIVDEIGGKRHAQRLKIIGGDVTDSASFEEAAEFFDPKKKIAVTCAGLFKYIDKEGTLRLLKNINKTLEQGGGSW